MNDYPTEENLEKIQSWSIKDKDSILDLISYMRVWWKWANAGYFKTRGVRVIRLEMHTGGWSGNEELIEALQENKAFWMMFWQKSERGGHYYFKIRL